MAMTHGTQPGAARPSHFGHPACPRSLGEFEQVNSVRDAAHMAPPDERAASGQNSLRKATLEYRGQVEVRPSKCLREAHSAANRKGEWV